MLIRRLRESLMREEGQALVLGCLMVLVLSIAVLTTVNIGHTVHEKVRLQNNADSAAYSMAALEARAFNFYSFANRTQVSHYVSAMVWQSMDSFLFFLEAFLTDLYGFMVTLDHCAPPSGLFWTAACKLAESIPYVGPILKVIDTIISKFGDVIKWMNDMLADSVGDGIDKALSTFVSLHRDLNGVLAALSTAVMYSAGLNIFGPGNAGLAGGVVGENDPNLGNQGLQVPLTYVNECMFDRAHMREANGSPFDPAIPFASSNKHVSPATVDRRAEDDKIARAKREMGNITDATRFACETGNGSSGVSGCPDSFVTSRRVGQLLGNLQIFGISFPGPIVSFLNKLDIWGQTRFQTYDIEYGQDGYNYKPPTNYENPGKGANKCGGKKPYANKPMNRIRQWQDVAGSDNGMLAQGDVLGSDDIYYLGFGPAGLPGGVLVNLFHCDEKSHWNECWGDPRANQKDTGPNAAVRTWPLKTSVWATSRKEQKAHGYNGGLHYRIHKAYDGGDPDDRKDYGLHGVNFCVSCAPLINKCLVHIGKYVADVRPRIENNVHVWDGIVPFSNFEPGQYANACGEQLNARGGDPSISASADRQHQEFNQPSQFVLFHKDPKEMRNPNADSTGGTTNAPAMLNDDGELTVTFGGSSQKLVMDDTQKKAFGFVSGVTAISRGQTYYHRPGNWAEQPNFFNPYWKPRLASVYQGRDELPFLGKMLNALPGPFKSIEQKILTH